MAESGDIREDLEPGAGDDVVVLAERLRESRPLPSPAFRGELGRALRARSRRRPSPARLRLLIALQSTAGLALLLVGAVSAGGVGPLG